MAAFFRSLLTVRISTWIQIVVLIGMTLAKGLFWIGLTPALLVADEPAHFDNVQFRAEHHGPPRSNGTKIEKVISNGASKEMLVLWRTTIPKGYYRKTYLHDRVPEKLEQLAKDAINRDGDGQDPAMDYPGLYYQLAVPFYDAFKTDSVVTRIMSVRILSLLFLMIATLATFFAMRLVHEDGGFAFVAASMMALQPMASQQGASVNNDAGIIGIGALAFYFQLRTLASLPKFPSPWTLAGLVLSTLAIPLTKPNGYGLLPGSVFVLVAVAIAHRRLRWVQIASACAVVLGLTGLLLAPSFGVNFTAMLPGDTNDPGPYGAPNFIAFFDNIDARFHDYLVRSSWGQFGWLDFSIEHTWVQRLRWVEDLFELGTIVAIVCYVLRPLDRPHWFRFWLWLFSLGTLLAGVTFILYVEHRFRLTRLLGVVQGRNFLYVMPAFAVWATVAAGATLPASMRRFSAAILFTGVVCFHVVAVLTIVHQHYATH